MTLSEVFECTPAAVTVFLRHRMSCVGCLMNCFDTLAEAAQNYQIPVEDLLKELELEVKQIQDLGGRTAT